MFSDKDIYNILLKLHDCGGCDAKDDYSRGWDEAISSAIDVVEKETNLKLEDILE